MADPFGRNEDEAKKFPAAPPPAGHTDALKKQLLDAGVRINRAEGAEAPKMVYPKSVGGHAGIKGCNDEDGVQGAAGPIGPVGATGVEGPPGYQGMIQGDKCGESPAKCTVMDVAANEVMALYDRMVGKMGVGQGSPEVLSLAVTVWKQVRSETAVADRINAARMAMLAGDQVQVSEQMAHSLGGRPNRNGDIFPAGCVDGGVPIRARQVGKTETHNAMQARRVSMGVDPADQKGSFSAHADMKLTDYIRQKFAVLSRGEKSELLNALNADFVEQDTTKGDEAGPHFAGPRNG